MYFSFYRWVESKDVLPFFHAFGTAEKPGKINSAWKNKWFQQIPALFGPQGVYPRVRVATFFPGDVYDIQTSNSSITGSKIAANAGIFDAFGYANATAAACCAGGNTCCFEYK